MDALSAGGAYDNMVASGDKLMSALQVRTGQLTQIAQTALASGIDKYQGEDYEGAAEDFQRYIGIMRPYAYDAGSNHYLGEATEYLSKAYVKQGDMNKAIKAYETGLEMVPDDVKTHANLGKLYYAVGRYGDAEGAYRDAYNLNTEDPNVAFSLGQALLSLDRFADAKAMFDKVVKLDTGSGNGEYGLGQTYRDMGEFEQAIEQFKTSVEINPDFYDAHAELGYLYADTGQMDLAQEVFEFLDDEDPDLADTLNRYMYKVENPKFGFIGADSTFSRFMGPNTPVAALDAYLANADTQKQFTMVFQFSKAMDMGSVQNRTNWEISRSDKSGPGEFYNYGRRVADTEARLSPIPDRVVYDPNQFMATLTFTITQNSAADATIDASHIVFKFNGEDKFGNPMGEDGDEYSAFTGID
jgi:tetratricopeptide (TPR) repeat protein